VSTKRAIDCSTPLTALSAAAIHKASFDGVLRYLGNWQKSLATGEPAIIHDAGLNLGLIYEANPTRAAAFSPAQAKTDVANAVASALSHGAPAGVGIAFTVDYDAAVHDLDAIVAYFGVILAGIGQYKPGAYGDDIVLDALYRTYGDKLFYWQTSAWSDGARFPHAALYQGAYDQTVGGVQCDIDDVLGNTFWWSPNQGGGNVSQPILQLTNPYTTGAAVKTLQTALNIHGAHPTLTVDGVFGPVTDNAVKMFQRSAELAVDGVVGPVTWGALDKPVVTPTPRPEPKPNPVPVPTIVSAGTLLGTFTGDVLQDAFYFQPTTHGGTFGHFQFDTGAWELVLAPRIANDLNLPNLGPTVQTYGAGTHMAHFSEIDIVIGDTVFAKQPCVVDEEWPDESVEFPSDGLFGLRFFTDNKLPFYFDPVTATLSIFAGK
jgi:peptidoglycan hydrolase-like protein with peptidoglycan-binding domain